MIIFLNFFSPQIVFHLLYRLNLMPYRCRIASMCSYGTNRKLSAALALLGKPSVLLLVWNTNFILRGIIMIFHILCLIVLQSNSYNKMRENYFVKARDCAQHMQILNVSRDSRERDMDLVHTFWQCHLFLLVAQFWIKIMLPHLLNSFTE